MSYKYLYGFTNEPSYDFTKVIYFGKQDRCESALSRIPEHYSEDDPNHEALKNAKYVLVAQVDTTAPLYDLEAYFIQSYKPMLNTVYNSDKNSREKLNNAELAELLNCAESLTWILINNSIQDAKHVEQRFFEIRRRNEIIERASYVFSDESEIEQTPCKDVVQKINNGTAIIKPKIANTTLCPLYTVTATDEDVLISNYTNSYVTTPDNYKTLPYCNIVPSLDIPELKITTGSFIAATKEYFSDELVETDEYIEFKQYLFDLWLTLVYFISKRLVSQEPLFTTNLSFNDICKGIDYLADINGGFHSSNWKYIQRIALMFYDSEVQSGWKAPHLIKLFDYKQKMEEVKYKNITSFVSEYADFYTEHTEDDIIFGDTTINDWITINCA